MWLVLHPPSLPFFSIGIFWPYKLSLPGISLQLHWHLWCFLGKRQSPALAVPADAGWASAVLSSCPLFCCLPFLSGLLLAGGAKCVTVRLALVFLRVCHLYSFLFFLSFFWNGVSLCSRGCPGTSSVDQAGLKLTDIHLPLPSVCWD